MMKLFAATQRGGEYWHNFTQEHAPSYPSHTEPFNTGRVRLRSHYKRDLSLAQAKSIPYIFIREESWNLFKGYSTIKHNYEVNIIRGDKVVIDYSTGLMWHQSGSPRAVTLKAARSLLQRLNNHGYAGYHDWRLPTLEEAA
ncbi:MAG: DUF1566 domain-containing protein [Candidatus Scalindua sp.]